MFYLKDGVRYYAGKAFTYGDVQYSPSGATHDKFIELGFTPVTIQDKPDTRFYYVTNLNDDGSWDSSPIDLALLKDQYVRAEKVRSREILKVTDWLVVRFAENNTAIPVDVETFRDNVRLISSDNCAEINACADLASLIALVGADRQIEDPNNPGTFIANPSGLAEFPEEVSGYDY